ncbi:retropepsin-like aspartic protease [Pontibacter pamirensis]|uniref:retropepsin-like aspartic protease n=1 Tax=Pontibacter pamirensis TaxID=2562824 RepID=UPI00138A1C77|nr:retropepsin-like aspartic protease [Pontibacter pamirensis]
MSKVFCYFIIALTAIVAACDAPQPATSVAAEALIERSDTAVTNVIADMSLDELLTKHQEYERIQLKKMSSGHLQMQVYLNGVRGNFILDTGAGATILEEKRKSAFHLKSRKSNKQVTGTGGGTMGMQLSTGNKMQIGQLEINNSSIYLINLDHVNKAFLDMKLEEVDGIIGADILSAKRGVIDYTNLVLYLRK